MNKGFWIAFGFFVLGFLCTLFLTGGKQVGLASVSFIASLMIIRITEEMNKRERRC